MGRIAIIPAIRRSLQYNSAIVKTGVAPPLFDLQAFSLSDMIACGAHLRVLDEEAQSLDEVARLAIRFFYESFRRPDGQRALALCRFYMTMPFSAMDADEKEFAVGAAGGVVPPNTRCLRLVASAGALPEWNDPTKSTAHRAIPLVSENSVAQSPMIAGLIGQLGVQVGMVVRPDPQLIVDMQQASFNVFHVGEAAGSPHIPAQDFVKKMAVKSVVGFGGLLPNGDLFAVIMFSNVPVSREVAEHFKTVALNLKLACLRFLEQR